MKLKRRIALPQLAVVLAANAACLMIGCHSGPPAVTVPEVDPAAAASGAIALYDKDGSGDLSQEELAACPAVLASLAIYDTDKNGIVTSEEIENRLRNFLSSKVGQTILQIQVSWNGRPLPNATVKLLPEPYLGDQVKPASGVTGINGIAAMDIRDEDLPESDRGITGVHIGTYKIEVTHPTVQLPAKYNTETTLGYETERGNPLFALNLKK